MSLGGVGWINLPRHRREQTPAGYGRREDWDLRWNVALPAPQPGEERVTELTEADAGAINELLDLAMPRHTTPPPGSTRDWGIPESNTSPQ